MSCGATKLIHSLHLVIMKKDAKCSKLVIDTHRGTQSGNQTSYSGFAYGGINVFDFIK